MAGNNNISSSISIVSENLISALRTPMGGHDVFLQNNSMQPEQPNIFSLDPNPVSIKFSRVADVDVKIVRGGKHYQFKRVRKDRGMIQIDTGTKGLQYLIDLGNWIETWMRKTTNNRTGPVTLTNNTVSPPDVLTVIFPSIPMIGKERSASTLGDVRYLWQIEFEIVESYAEKAQLSSITDAKLIPVPRGSNIIYDIKDGDTLNSIAKVLYNDQDGGKNGVALLQSIPSNHLGGFKSNEKLPSSFTGKTVIAPSVSQAIYLNTTGSPSGVNTSSSHTNQTQFQVDLTHWISGGGVEGSVDTGGSNADVENPLNGFRFLK